MFKNCAKGEDEKKKVSLYLCERVTRINLYYIVYIIPYFSVIRRAPL